jgi:hypothetical protein
MPTLEEYLGGLFASLTQARMLTDLESARTAEIYSRHELLRHFSVPRMRFREVELTVPVAIDAFPAGTEGGIGPGARDGIRTALLNALTRALGIRFVTQAIAAILTEPLDAGIDRLIQRASALARDENLARFAAELGRDIARLVETGAISLPERRPLDTAALTRSMGEVAAAQIATITPASGGGGPSIIAEAHRLREQRPSDVIVIKMTVTEEGMEWHQLEQSDGAIERKLLPE